MFGFVSLTFLDLFLLLSSRFACLGSSHLLSHAMGFSPPRPLFGPQVFIPKPEDAGKQLRVECEGLLDSQRPSETIQTTRDKRI